MDGMRVSDPRIASQMPEWLDHPAFSALLSRTKVVFGRAPSPCGISVNLPGSLTVERELKPSFRNLVTFRLALELVWLLEVPDLDADAALLLAARAASGFIACLCTHDKADGLTDELVSAIGLCGSTAPKFVALQKSLERLRALDLVPGSAFKPLQKVDAIYNQVLSLWSVARASESLLTCGGDDRLMLDEATGLNRYGCSPFPQSNVVDLASSTASNITFDALVAVEASRQELVRDTIDCGEESSVEKFSTDIRRRILSHFDLEEHAECLLAASGTDAALLTTYLLGRLSPEHCLNSILMSPHETGSGIPYAVLGRHFADFAAGGCKVSKATPVVDQMSRSYLRTIATREADGSRRTGEAIDSDCIDAVERELRNRPVVLHALQDSKTGLTVPSQQILKKLAKAQGAEFHVVIDACQLRCNPGLVRDHIGSGYVVLITGSKFFCAPGFCGAIVFPKTTFRSLEQATGDFSALEPYATSLNGIIQRRCPGLILRWTAALYSMQRSKIISYEKSTEYLEQAETQLRLTIAKYPRFQLIDDLREEKQEQSRQHSIFTFKVKSSRGFLAIEDLRLLYERAYQPTTRIDAQPDGVDSAVRIRFGQPVRLGDSGAAGLRIAISARHIFEQVDLEPDFDVAFAKLSALLDPV